MGGGSSGGGRLPSPRPGRGAAAGCEQPAAGGSENSAGGKPESASERTPQRSVPTKPAKPSSLLDTRVVYCGDNLEQLAKLPDACVDLIYIDPPFNSNRNYEVFWGETKEKRAFEDRHENTRDYIDYSSDALQEIESFFKRSHKVIVALTVQEILDEQIAKKLV